VLCFFRGLLLGCRLNLPGFLFVCFHIIMYKAVNRACPPVFDLKKGS
jgi:hypothetical protein